MERIWKNEAELKAIISRLDPVAREAAKEFGNLLHSNSGAHFTEMLTMACARALDAAGSTDPMDLIRLSDEQVGKIGVVGMAIVQWWEEAKKGNVHDEELARILSDRDAIDRHMEDSAAQLPELLATEDVETSPRPGNAGRAKGRCPACGFGYGWNQGCCHHCGFGETGGMTAVEGAIDKLINLVPGFRQGVVPPLDERIAECLAAHWFMATANDSIDNASAGRVAESVIRRLTSETWSVWCGDDAGLQTCFGSMCQAMKAGKHAAMAMGAGAASPQDQQTLFIMNVAKSALATADRDDTDASAVEAVMLRLGELHKKAWAIIRTAG